MSGFSIVLLILKLNVYSLIAHGQELKGFIFSLKERPVSYVFKKRWTNQISHLIFLTVLYIQKTEVKNN